MLIFAKDVLRGKKPSLLLLQQNTCGDMKTCCKPDQIHFCSYLLHHSCHVCFWERLHSVAGDFWNPRTWLFFYMTQIIRSGAAAWRMVPSCRADSAGGHLQHCGWMDGPSTSLPPYFFLGSIFSRTTQITFWQVSGTLWGGDMFFCSLSFVWQFKERENCWGSKKKGEKEECKVKVLHFFEIHCLKYFQVWLFKHPKTEW